MLLPLVKEGGLWWGCKWCSRTDVTDGLLLFLFNLFSNGLHSFCICIYYYPLVVQLGEHMTIVYNINNNMIYIIYYIFVYDEAFMYVFLFQCSVFKIAFFLYHHLIITQSFLLLLLLFIKLFQWFTIQYNSVCT